MKKKNKINLNQLAKKEVDMKKSEMKAVRGGACCCVCINTSASTAAWAVGGHANTAVPMEQ